MPDMLSETENLFSHLLCKASNISVFKAGYANESSIILVKLLMIGFSSVLKPNLPWRLVLIATYWTNLFRSARASSCYL